MTRVTKVSEKQAFWALVLGNFLGGFLALVAIMLVKFVITGRIM